MPGTCSAHAHGPTTTRTARTAPTATGPTLTSATVLALLVPTSSSAASLRAETNDLGNAG